jgi:redox-regulated HSP33 family molecular chaperone
MFSSTLLLVSSFLLGTAMLELRSKSPTPNPITSVLGSTVTAARLLASLASPIT